MEGKLSTYDRISTDQLSILNARFHNLEDLETIGQIVGGQVMYLHHPLGLRVCDFLRFAPLDDHQVKKSLTAAHSRVNSYVFDHGAFAKTSEGAFMPREVVEEYTWHAQQHLPRSSRATERPVLHGPAMPSEAVRIVRFVLDHTQPAIA